MGFCTHLILLHSGQNRGKKGFWDNVLVSCKQFSTLPPLADVRLLSKTEKNIEKSKDSGTMCWYHANSSPPYPPCRCQAPVPKPKTTSRNRKILSKTKKNLEKSKKKKKNKKTKDSGTMCWYHVNILLARLCFFFFFPRFLEVSFGFGPNLSISRCFF